MGPSIDSLDFHPLVLCQMFSQAYHWTLQGRGADRFKLAEFLPAEPALGAQEVRFGVVEFHSSNLSRIYSIPFQGWRD